LRDNPERSASSLCYLRPVSTLPIRDRAAIAIAAFAIVVGLLALLFGAYDTGIAWHWESDTGRLVVNSVEPLSQADRDGVVAGMIAVELNGNTLINLPQ